MTIEFWQNLWETDELPFHLQEINPNLLKSIDVIQSNQSTQSILVPLCGKSVDMKYFLDNGYQVTGIELSEKAVTDFFKEQNIEYQKEVFDNYILYYGHNIQIYCGDYFIIADNLSPAYDLIYDRAALIALPPKLRKKYSEKLIQLCHESTQMLLVTMAYPQELIEGPPFSVPPEEIDLLYSNHFSIKELHQNYPENVPEAVKGKVTQRCYLLKFPKV